MKSVVKRIKNLLIFFVTSVGWAGTAHRFHAHDGQRFAFAHPTEKCGKNFDRAFIVTLLAAVLIGSWTSEGIAGVQANLEKLVGADDAVLVIDPQGKTLFEKNADQKQVPASVLKLLTALFARHTLGADFKFKTRFYQNADGDLFIKGFGDPMLISESLPALAAGLRAKISACRDIVLDDSYFVVDVIPGATQTYNPYDAPSGALCVNFNTVEFTRKGGKILSGEPQTPMLPIAENKIRQAGLKRGRIVLSSQGNEHTFYAGQLIRTFLEKAGVRITGQIRTGRVNMKTERLIHVHVSPYSLDEAIARLLEFSNNFIANQLFITAGIQTYGPPGTLAKSVAAMQKFLKDDLKIGHVDLAEGSGLSRENRVSARQVINVLNSYNGLRHLMKNEGREFFKTGSLTGVKSRAGFIEGMDGKLTRFVVLVNTPGKSTRRIMKAVHRLAEGK